MDRIWIGTQNGITLLNGLEIKKFGSEQVQIWRRSFDVPPPGGESLKMTAERTLPYYNDVIKPQVNTGKNIIISAHGNSIRAIVMEIFNLSSEQILKTEIGWCEPWIISFDDHGELSNYQIIKKRNINRTYGGPKSKRG